MAAEVAVSEPSGDVTDPMGNLGPLAEFSALRSEREMRYQRQHQYHTLQMAAVAATFSFALSSRGSITLLLVIPIISYLLCGRLSSQHYANIQISRYIAERLSPRVPGGLHWEQWSRDQSHRGRYLTWILPLLLS